MMRAVKVIAVFLIAAVLAGVVAFLKYPQETTVLSYDKCGNDFFFISNTTSGYQMLEVSPESKIVNQVTLEDPFGWEDCSFDYIRTDDIGNLYLLVTRRMGEDSAQIKSESVLLYDSRGNFISQLMGVDWEGQEIVTEQPYIKTISVMGNSAYAIGVNQQLVEVQKLSQTETVAHTKVMSVDMGKEKIFKDAIVLDDTTMVLLTLNGDILLYQDQTLSDITYLLGERVQAVTLSADARGNVYVAENFNQKYYQINVRHLTATVVFDKDSVLNKKNDVRFSEVESVEYVEDGVYAATAISDIEKYFISTGKEEVYVQKIKQPLATGFVSRFLPVFLIIFALTAAVLGAILYLVAKFRNRMPVAAKFILGFVPFYMISMAILSGVLTSMVSQTYTKGFDLVAKTGIRFVASQIDSSAFGKIDMLKDVGTKEYQDFYRSTIDAETKIKELTDSSVAYQLLYAVEDDDLYLIISDDFMGRQFYEPNYQPLSYMYGSQAHHYYDALARMMDPAYNGEAILFNITYMGSTTSIGTWRCVLMPVYDSAHNIVAILEAGVDYDQYYNSIRTATFATMAIGITIVAVIICAYFVLMMRSSLRPLGILGKAVTEISNGRYGELVEINSKDEFGDIGKAFNLMSIKIKKYIANMTDFNNAYMKFVAKEYFSLLDRKNVLSLQEHDKMTSNFAIMHIDFLTRYSDEELLDMKLTNMFDNINRNFDILTAIIQQNDGIVTSYDGTGTTAVFPEDTRGALIAATMLKEAFVAKGTLQGISLVISYGNSLVGVAGNDQRKAFIIISPQAEELPQIKTKALNFGVQYLFTEYLHQNLDENTNAKYRWIGSYYSSQQKKSIGLYELLDGSEQYEKQLKQQTKTIFELAVANYQKGDLVNARRNFIDVYRINTNDRLAAYYLILCDEQSGKEKQQFQADLFIV